jgi:hypothetical protein
MHCIKSYMATQSGPVASGVLLTQVWLASHYTSADKLHSLPVDTVPSFISVLEDRTTLNNTEVYCGREFREVNTHVQKESVVRNVAAAPDPSLRSRMWKEMLKALLPMLQARRSGFGPGTKSLLGNNRENPQKTFAP